MGTSVESIAGGVVAIALVAVTGLVTKTLLKTKPFSWEVAEKQTPGILWSALQPRDIEASGSWIGFLERTLALISAWTGQYELLGGWFAFKVASKWETYANVLRLPDEINGIDELDYLRARRAWGSRVAMRFLAGSATNAIIGICAAGFGKWIGPIIAAQLKGWGIDA
jgi:hypothetical protein